MFLLPLITLLMAGHAEGSSDIDDIVRPDGPVFPAVRSLLGDFDVKDLADLRTRRPFDEIVKRFSSLPKTYPKEDVQKVFDECFYPGFPCLEQWKPPDTPTEPPSWLRFCRIESLAADEGKQSTSTAGDPLDTAAITPSPRRRTKALRREPDDPASCGGLTDTAENEFAFNLIKMWRELGRKTTHSAASNSAESGVDASNDRGVSSLIDLPYGMVVPGGRFRELYYWDSYWTLRGLLYSGMVDTARDTILNFRSILQRFGLIPNGTRTYYLSRSQPPVFSMMISAYFAFTGDLEFVSQTYADVEREYLYWWQDDSRSATVSRDGVSFRWSRYIGHLPTPRVESWEKDVALCERTMGQMASQGTETQRTSCDSLYRNVRAAAESGWDFSSRWVPDDVDVQSGGVLPNLKTEDIIPVDLNSFLYHAELFLAHFGRIFELEQDSQYLQSRQYAAAVYQQRAEERRRAMIDLFWDDEAGWWFDYSLSQGRRSRRVTAAGVAPFSMQVHAPVEARQRQLFVVYASDLDTGNESYVSGQGNDGPSEVERAARLKQLKTAHFLISESGLWKDWGLSTTVLETGEQWDGSNCWPPLFQMAMEGLIDTEGEAALNAAKSMTGAVLVSLSQAYDAYGALPEKWNSLVPGACGRGGEYQCQKGFGWTIGVALELIFWKRTSFKSDTAREIRRLFGISARKRLSR